MNDSQGSDTTNTGNGEVRKQFGARGFFGRVRVHCREAGHRPTLISISPAAAGDWERSEGWVDGAIVGVGIGIRLAGTTADCEFTSIHGMCVDSSPTVMAIAGIRAAWDAVGFKPSDEMRTRLESLVLRSRGMLPEQLEVELRRQEA
jgi:hypothetical protein